MHRDRPGSSYVDGGESVMLGRYRWVAVASDMGAALLVIIKCLRARTAGD
jgi:hypothetical protein